jgi:hypothetical protein
MTGSPVHTVAVFPNVTVAPHREIAFPFLPNNPQQPKVTKLK